MPEGIASSDVSSVWRTQIKIHPAADLFPLMPENELEQLAEDISKYGIQEPVVCLEDGTLLDGRNRLNAMERAGLPILDDDGKLLFELCTAVTVADPYAYVVSANYHRRQLTPAQMRELIERYKERNPCASSRSIANAIRTSKSTVGRVLKARAVPPGTPAKPVEGRDGKSYPAKKGAPKSNASKAQARDQAIDGFARLLSRQTRQTLEGLVKILEGERAKITAEPLSRRMAWALAYVKALDVDVNDLRSDEEPL